MRDVHSLSEVNDVDLVCDIEQIILAQVRVHQTTLVYQVMHDLREDGGTLSILLCFNGPE